LVPFQKFLVNGYVRDAAPFVTDAFDDKGLLFLPASYAPGAAEALLAEHARVKAGHPSSCRFKRGDKFKGVRGAIADIPGVIMIQRVLPGEVEILFLPSGYTQTITPAYLRKTCMEYTSTFDALLDTEVHEDRLPVNDVNTAWLTIADWNWDKWENWLEDAGWDEESYERCLDARIERKLGANLL